jgi:hypothetical protein
MQPLIPWHFPAGHGRNPSAGQVFYGSGFIFQRHRPVQVLQMTGHEQRRRSGRPDHFGQGRTIEQQAAHCKDPFDGCFPGLGIDEGRAVVIDGDRFRRP